MNNSKTIDLVKGNFATADAREIVLTLLSTEMKFHNLRNFSSEERFGESDPVAMQKLEYLRQEREEAELFFSDAIAKGKTITMDLTLTMVTD